MSIENPANMGPQHNPIEAKLREVIGRNPKLQDRKFTPEEIRRAAQLIAKNDNPNISDDELAELALRARLTVRANEEGRVPGLPEGE